MSTDDITRLTGELRSVKGERDRLEAEVERLRAGLDHCHQAAGPDSCAAVLVENERLRAELQESNRLRDDALRKAVEAALALNMLRGVVKEGE